jgi:single-strand DNA-binding protein
MSSINSVVLVGNLTRDPELRHTASGYSVADFRIAVSDRRKVNGEWGEVPYYFNVTVWGNQGEACATYLRRGSKVGVQGKLTWREWDAQDGTKRQAVDVEAFSVQFLTPRGEGDGGGSRSEQFVPAGGGGDDFDPGTGSGGDDFQSSDDDIPF